jgi:hypothetical protein
LAQASIAALRAALLVERGVRHAMPTRKEMEAMEMDAGSQADVEDTVIVFLTIRCNTSVQNNCFVFIVFIVFPVNWPWFLRVTKNQSLK